MNSVNQQGRYNCRIKNNNKRAGLPYKVSYRLTSKSYRQEPARAYAM